MTLIHRFIWRRFWHLINRRCAIKKFSSIPLLVFFFFFFLGFSLIQLSSIERESVFIPGYPDAINYTQLVIQSLDIKRLDNVQPLEPQMGVVVNDVNSFRYPINDGYQRCRQMDRSRANYFVLVTSSARNYENRHSIRQTWAKEMQSGRGRATVGNYSFFIGLTRDADLQQLIDKESAIYGDIIQVSLYDSYKTAAKKTVALLHWTLNFCPQIEFLFKSADNIYINSLNLVNVVNDVSKMDEKGIYGVALSCKSCPDAIIGPERDKSESHFSSIIN